MGNPSAEITRKGFHTLPEGYTEEVRSVLARAKHQADEILEKARALLRETRSVQGSRDLSYEEHRAEARQIGFDEGFRLGKAQGEESALKAAVLQSLSKDSPEAVAVLENAALQLREERSDLEAEKRRTIDGLRHIVEAASSSEEDLSAALLQFLKEHPPSITLKYDEPLGDAHARRARRRERRASGKDVVTDRKGVRAGDR